MPFAQIIDGEAVLLDPSKDVVCGENVASYETVTIWSEEERNAFGVYTVKPADPAPEGKVINSTEIKVVDGEPVEVVTYLDVPVERRLIPKSTIMSRLHAAGKFGAVWAILKAPGNEYADARWHAPDWPNIYADDPEMLAILNAVGADIPTITAE